MGRLRIQNILASSVLTPPSGKATIFLDLTDGLLKAKKDDGSISLLESISENIVDAIAGALVAGNAIVINYNDPADTLTISVDETQIDHVNLQNVGTNTHAQIDSHIANTSNPHATTAAQVGAYTTAQTDAEISGAIAVHEAASDPHPQYLTLTEGNVAYTPLSHVGTGGTQHANATVSTAGFISAADKSKLDVISANRIIKSGTVAGIAFVGMPRIAIVTFGTAFPDTNYSIAITGANSRSWSFQTKAAGSFVINSNANGAIAGEVTWTCISYGESVE